jgi:hypothetical protein
MYLRIQAKPAGKERFSLYGRNISISVSLVESHRINGKSRQTHLGALAYIVVEATQAEAKTGKIFWSDLRRRMENLGVEKELQLKFQEQIEKLLETIKTAKQDQDLREGFYRNPNKILSQLRK